MSGVPRHVLLVAFSFLLVLLRFSSDGGGAGGFVFPYTSGSGRGTPTAHQRATRTGHQCRTRPAYRRVHVLSLAPRARKVAVEGAQRVTPSLGVGLSGKDAVDQAGERLIPLFAEVDAHTKRTLRRVLDTFREFRVGSNVFAGVDGYGHGDIGRETLDKVYARLFGAEAALVRVQCFSGTHAIACALFGVLRPGDAMLACSGRPYDTLDEVIGTRKPMNDEYADASDPLPEGLIGNLKEFHVSYTEVPLQPGGLFDLEAIDAAIEADPAVRLLHVQRSCGYQWRPSLPIKEIERLCSHVKARWAERGLVVFVDNCYGEFVEDKEPCHVGADLIAGSLIKNPGGTIAKSGGYVAGKLRLVRAAANRLGAPGVAGGATLGQNQNLFQGLFLAPTIVGESLKGAILLAEVFGGTFGLPTNPPPRSPSVVDDTAADVNGDTQGAAAAGGGSVGAEVGGGGVGGRTDIVQALELGDRDRLIKFCEAVQLFSPVNAYVRPVPGVTPGYGDEVIFADGTFVDGSTLELSSDGPLRPPYVVFAQGCTHWAHWALIIEQALLAMGLVEE
ncbi:unnamed protein product [Ectocarpus sp. CCAP 1310/34]|nr:unnamed protein product [Ectocarpus sp. CCAP 1310/34]